MKSAISKITSSWEFDISKNKAIDIPVWLCYDVFFFRFCSCWFVGGGKMSYLQKLFLFTVNEREFFWYGSYRCRSSRPQSLLYLREQLVDSPWRNMELGFLLQCSGILLLIIPVIDFKFFSGFVYPCELLSWGLATMSVSNCKQEKLQCLLVRVLGFTLNIMVGNNLLHSDYHVTWTIEHDEEEGYIVTRLQFCLCY